MARESHGVNTNRQIGIHVVNALAQLVPLAIRVVEAELERIGLLR